MFIAAQVYDAFISRDGDDKLELTLSDGGCIKTDFVSFFTTFRYLRIGRSHTLAVFLKDQIHNEVMRQ